MGNTKRPKNRATKKTLVFDESARHDYLTGFKKRKDERRKKAQLEIEEKIKEQRKLMRQKHLAMLKKSQTRMQKEAEDIDDMESTIFASANHTVTVTDLADNDNTTKFRLGTNAFKTVENETSGSQDDKADEAPKDKTKSQSLLKTHKLSKSNKLMAKPSYRKSKHKSFTHETKSKHKNVPHDLKKKRNKVKPRNPVRNK